MCDFSDNDLWSAKKLYIWSHGSTSMIAYVTMYSMTILKLLIQMLSRTIFTLLIYFLLLAFVTAQDDVTWTEYSQGYYITTEGIQIEGLISTPYFDQRIRSLRVRATPQSAPQTIPLNSISSFGKDNLQFEVRSVTIDPVKRSLTEPAKTTSAGLITEYAALRVIVNGPLRLYDHVGPMLNTYYFTSIDNEEITYLPYENYRTQSATGSEGRVVIKNLWRGLLTKTFMKDCATVAQHSKNTTYSRPSLIKLYTYYYECIGVQPVISNNFEKEKGVLSIVPSLGGVYSSHSFLENNFQGPAFDWEDPSTLSPLFGVMVRYRFRPKSAFAFELGAWYHQAEVTDEAPAVDAFNQGLSRFYNYEEKVLDIDLGVSYRPLSKGQFSAFVELGLRRNTMLKVSELRSQERRNGLPPQSRGTSATNRGHLEPYMGVSLSAGKFEVRCRLFQFTDLKILPGDLDLRESYIFRTMITTGYRL